jgi:hypothetical protein
MLRLHSPTWEAPSWTVRTLSADHLDMRKSGRRDCSSVSVLPVVATADRERYTIPTPRPTIMHEPFTVIEPPTQAALSRQEEGPHASSGDEGRSATGADSGGKQAALTPQRKWCLTSEEFHQIL